MHPSAAQTQEDPTHLAWAAKGHQLVTAASAARQKLETVQEEESAPQSLKEESASGAKEQAKADGGAAKGVDLNARYEKLIGEARKIPETVGARALFLTRLNGIEKEIASGDAAALAKQLAKIEEQIAKVLSAKPRSASEEETRKQWVKETYTPKQAQFKKECETATDKLVEAAKKRAGDASLSFDFIFNKVVQTRLAFEQELGLEGSGDGAAILKEFQGELAAVEKELIAFIASERFVKVAEDEASAAKGKAEGQKRNAEEQALADAKKGAAVALAQLEDLGNAQAANLSKELKAVKNKDEAAAVQKKIEAAVKAHTEKSDKDAKAHEESVDKMSAGVEKIAKNIKNADAKKSLETLKDELEKTKALAKTGNEAAAKAAEAMSKQIAALAAAAADEKSDFSKLFAEVKAQQDALDTDDVKTHFAAEQEELSKALTKLSGSVDPLELAAAEKELAGVKAKVTALTEKAQDLADYRQVVTVELKMFKGMLQTYRDAAADRNNFITRGLGGLADRFFGEQTKISLLMKEIEEGYQKPGVDTAKTDALRIELSRRLGDMEDIWQTVRTTGKIDPLKAALEGEAAAATTDLEAKKEAEKKKKEDRDAWDKDYKEFKDKVGVLKELVKKSKGPEDEIATMLSLVEAGHKMAENGDVAGARDKLKLAEKRRADLEKCPGGVTVQSAAELAKLKAKWDESLTQLGAKLKELKDAVDKEAGLSQEQREGAVKKINAIPALFRAGAFNKDIDEITKTEDNDVRKKAREKILKQVRQYRALMEGNAVLQLARRNPFDVKQVTTPVNKCLASIELNTLRAVRAE
jgi:hypothetical protein